MRAILAAIFAIALAGCATTTPFPNMRPLTQSHIETMGPTRVVVSENNSGVEKSWFYTSTASAGAAYGLIGALVSVAMDAIINAGPSARAQKAANEMAELIDVNALNVSLAERFRQQAPTDAAALTGVSYSGVETVQRLTSPGPIDDAVDVSVRYTLSEDSSTLRIMATATYKSPQTPYVTPYEFSGSVPRSETQGPAYRNTFTYYSAQLPVPTLTQELRERLVASIQDSARDANGALPAQDSDAFRAMNQELEKARDNNLSKDEIAIFLTREWLQDGGVMLRQEIEQAHTFIARYVLLDLNHPVAPSLTGQDELLETMSDERTVRRIGSGPETGSYVSSAANVATFSTYGNTIGIAASNRERIESIEQASRRTSAN